MTLPIVIPNCVQVRLSGRHWRGSTTLGSFLLCPRFRLLGLWLWWTNTSRSSGRDLTAFVRVRVLKYSHTDWKLMCQLTWFYVVCSKLVFQSIPHLSPDSQSVSPCPSLLEKGCWHQIQKKRQWNWLDNVLNIFFVLLSIECFKKNYHMLFHFTVS